MTQNDSRYPSVDPRTDVERAVALLREDAAYDDDRQTLVTHFIYCPDEVTAREVVAAAGDLGLDLTAEVGAPDPSAPGNVEHRVELAHYLMVDADTLLTLRETFETIAGSFGATYDGWAASPQDQIDP